MILFSPVERRNVQSYNNTLSRAISIVSNSGLGRVVILRKNSIILRIAFAERM
jgi:hypothetical protein